MPRMKKEWAKLGHHEQGGTTPQTHVCPEQFDAHILIRFLITAAFLFCFCHLGLLGNTLAREINLTVPE